MKLLVVEDEPDVIFLLERKCREYLREGVFAFVFTSDGLEALDYLRHCAPGDLPLIALLDINMPRMDGLTLLGHIIESWPFIKCIMTTAYGDMTNIRTAMNYGAFDFLTKPIDFNDLFMTINKALVQIHGRERGEQEKRELRQAYQQIKTKLRHLLHPRTTSPTSLKAALTRCEHLTILQAMARHDGNVTKAAEELGIHRRTLQRKLQQLDLNE